ncbi:GM19505 [Drosophila sechellia]|uniref:GM19505 n=1 Tax=Drosophila sechellia TaxID=7238 RepID=B4ICQ1_DROSE|nr:GM19505 [Drosophila sechellia]
MHLVFAPFTSCRWRCRWLCRFGSGHICNTFIGMGVNKHMCGRQDAACVRLCVCWLCCVLPTAIYANLFGC